MNSNGSKQTNRGYRKLIILLCFALAAVAAACVLLYAGKAWKRITQARQSAQMLSALSHGFPPPAETDLALTVGAGTCEGRINQMIRDVTFVDLAGTQGSIRDYRGTALVVSMTSIGCPISKKLVPALERFAERNRGESVQLLLVNADVDPSADELREHAARFPGWRYVHDPEKRLAAALGVTTTTETFVIDEAQTLRYRGALNDQYDIGVTRESVESDYLQSALTEVLGHHPLGHQVTAAPGCELGVEALDGSTVSATWHNQISRFVHYNCVECHRPGEAAPFSLETYEQVLSKKKMIERVLVDGTMPPWFADASYGNWRNARFVTKADRETFSRWVAEGCVEGDPADTPVMLERTSGWTISSPDIVIDVEPQQVPAEGVPEWLKFPVAFDVTNDVWVAAAEIRPSEPEVVHHAMLFVEYPQEDPRRLAQTVGESEESGGGAGFWLSYFPGRKAMILPPGRGKLIPRHGNIYLQLHYTPNGRAVVDKPRIGLKLLPGPPETAVVSGAILKGDITIPPNARARFVHSEVLGEDIRLLALMPHMHYRGSAAGVFLKHPDGHLETLLSVTNYDFNWQVAYEFKDPFLVTRGTELVIYHEFDNTRNNPRNPDPTQEVRYGWKTADEMMVNFFDWEPVARTDASDSTQNRPFN